MLKSCLNISKLTLRTLFYYSMDPTPEQTISKSQAKYLKKQEEKEKKKAQQQAQQPP